MAVRADFDAIYERLEFVPFRAPERMARESIEDIDPGIREAVAILNWHGIQTCQSCHGGPDHSYPEPTVDFIGSQSSALRALAAAIEYGLPVMTLRHAWHLGRGDGMPFEDVWQLVFRDSIREGIDEPTKHLSAPPGQTLTPCCGREMWNLPSGEHLTNDVAFATCRGSRDTT